MYTVDVRSHVVRCGSIRELEPAYNSPGDLEMRSAERGLELPEIEHIKDIEYRTTQAQRQEQLVYPINDDGHLTRIIFRVWIKVSAVSLYMYIPLASPAALNVA